MGYNLRQFETEGKFHRALTFDTRERAVPLATIKAVLQAEGVRVPRERKHNMVVIMLVTRAMNLYPPLSLRYGMQKLAQGRCFVSGGGCVTSRRVR
jgi:hypothetical protein